MKMQTGEKKAKSFNSDKWFSFFYLAPFLVIFFIFTLLPVVLSFILSFTDFNGLEIPRFIFFENYLQLFLSDDEFLLKTR